MKGYKLHYADINEWSDIPCFEFDRFSQMINFIDEKCGGRKDLVWLVTKGDTIESFISDSQLSIQDFLSNKSTWKTTGHFYLQEYSSFEDAHKVAFDMTEESPLCYSK